MFNEIADIPKALEKYVGPNPFLAKVEVQPNPKS